MNEFNDPELQTTVENYKTNTVEIIQKMNSISQDIRNLESYMKKNFSYLEYKTMVPFEDTEVILYFRNGRIYHEEKGDVRPLIETKIRQRIRIAPFLSRFLKSAMENNIFN